MNFLHLSDIHFRRDYSSDIYDIDRDLRNELELDVGRLLPRMSPIEGILVTGDIAFAGLREEYEIASDWLARVCDLASCDRDKVWVVAGNHDVERHVIAKSETLLSYHQTLRGTTDIDGQIAAFMRDGIAQRVLFDPITHYNNFAERFNCHFNKDRPYWEQELELNDGSVLRLRGLNTTLISSDSDDSAGNKLILGSIQSKPLVHSGVTYLTLAHHPPQWFRDEDQVDLNLETRVHIQLFGHKHKQRLQNINNTIRIVAGAVHPNRREPDWLPRYNFVSLVVSSVGNGRELTATIYPRIWSPDENKFKGDYDSNGRDERSFRLKLEAWNAPIVAASASEIDALGFLPNAAVGGNNRIESSVAVAEERAAMNKARRLAYRFYSLPYDVRLKIVETQGLIRKEDEELRGNELFNAILHRAKEENRLSQLWDEVQAAHGDGLYSENPFRKNSENDKQVKDA